MKKLLNVLPVIAIVLASCSNEFDVAAPWKEVPVAYAILSPKDTAHYIRVEKAFLDPETDALQIAQIADSLYYPEDAITVYLQRLKTGMQYPLQRIDGALEGYPREGGIFATQPNWLYKIKPSQLDSLRKGETYRMVIDRTDGSGRPPIMAQTTIPADITFFDPSPNDIPPRIAFYPSRNTDVEWRCDSNCVFFNVTFTIRYREQLADGTVILPKPEPLIWRATGIADREPLGNPNYFRGLSMIPGIDFYKFLSENISPASDRFRYFERLDITITGGGKEIEKYLVTANANSGLTGAEVITSYTNLSEGFGIFTSKNSSVLGQVLLEPKVVDSMNVHPLTLNLNFRL